MKRILKELNCVETEMDEVNNSLSILMSAFSHPVQCISQISIIFSVRIRLLIPNSKYFVSGKLRRLKTYRYGEEN